MKVIHENNSRGGIFKTIENGMEIGELTYTWDNGVMIIDHTGVISSYSGRGVGKNMLRKAVEYARENQVKIYPVCSFARKEMNENADLQDIIRSI